jgi:hypothetical protein
MKIRGRKRKHGGSTDGPELGAAEEGSEIY